MRYHLQNRRRVQRVAHIVIVSDRQRDGEGVSLRLRLFLFLSRCFCTVLQTVVIGIRSFHRGRCKMKLAIEDKCVCVSVILPKQKHDMWTP